MPFSQVYQTSVKRTTKLRTPAPSGCSRQCVGHLRHEHDEDEVVEQLEEADGPTLDDVAVRSRRTHPLAQRESQPGRTTRRHRAIVLTVRTPTGLAGPVAAPSGFDTVERWTRAASGGLVRMAATPDRDRPDQLGVAGWATRRPQWAGPRPVPLTRLVGRSRESAGLQALLQGAAARLVTLTGPGGVGKTRLALDVASNVGGRPSFDTVGFVPLAAVRDPDLVPVTIARALGITASDEATASELKAFLERRTMLLILDNLEHLLDAGPGLVDLLGAHPGLTILVTSRALLRVSGEHVVTVPPLDLPGPGPLPPAHQLVRFGAVQLFVDRSAAISPGFAADEGNAADVVEVCRRLDGLPLAIELAAARVPVLPPAALLARLERRLPLLTEGPHDQPDRLRTMQAGIAWSHDLLSPTEQRLFRRLAVFAGGFTLEAAESVTDDVAGALDSVSDLVDKSLVHREVSTTAEARFAMLETIREYAMEQLDASDEKVDVYRAHAGYFTGLAEQAESSLRGPSQQVWRDRLEAELDNLRAALTWTLAGSDDPEDADTGLRLVGALWYFWFQRGLTGEARRWLTRALDTAPSHGRARAQALLGAGTLAWRQGDCVTARAYLDDSVQRWRDASDPSGLAEALHVLGHVRFDQGDHADARDLFDGQLGQLPAGWRHDRWTAPRRGPGVGGLPRRRLRER